MHTLKVAIPTKGHRGMADEVSDVFGRATTFTIIEIERNEVQNVEVLTNPATSYQHGAGPVVVKTLTDLGVTAMIASEFGLGVSTLLDHFNIAKLTVKPDTPVAEAIQRGLSIRRKRF